MLDKLNEIEKRYLELEHKLADPDLMRDKNQYQKLAKEFSGLEYTVKKYRQLKTLFSELTEFENLAKDKISDLDFLTLAKEEIPLIKEKIALIEKELEETLQREDKTEDRDVIIEIRAGTGGDEASLFAADLFRMYTKYGLKNNWETEVMSSHQNEAGGFKEVVFSIKGKGVYRRLKYESGVHRVQRVPVTEASGRIHTSTATVAVMMEAEEVDIVIDPKDLKIDVFRSSGPGGQSVNTTDSAVRITHIPTQTVVTCQDERSQLKNKNKALRVLRTRILDKKRQEETAKIARERKAQIGTGERSEKIRTYNFPDRRITDHRIGLTVHQLEKVLDGELDEIIDALLSEEAKQKISESHKL